MLKCTPKLGYTGFGVHFHVGGGGEINERFVSFVLLILLYLFCMKLILLCGGLRQR